MENQTTKCGQLRCGYNSFGGCKNCEVCNAEPNEVNDFCDKCHNCQFDEGILRWNDDDEKKEEQKETIKELMKPIEVKK